MLIYNLSQTFPGPISGLSSRGQLQRRSFNFWWMEHGRRWGKTDKNATVMILLEFDLDIFNL